MTEIPLKWAGTVFILRDGAEERVYMDKESADQGTYAAICSVLIGKDQLKAQIVKAACELGGLQGIVALRHLFNGEQFAIELRKAQLYLKEDQPTTEAKRKVVMK